MKNLLDEDKKIHGRCGYRRQGFPFVIKDGSFNSYAIHVDGVNSKLADIDYNNALKENI